jgi:tRNA threonylcarbamoyl adenosine modification protein YjeE
MADWGRTFGAALPQGAVVALHGELGAGKTTLVRAIAEGLGVIDLAEVTSPTYALVHEYHAANGVVVHADLYRLRRADELDELGWEELLAGARAALVEWPERANGRLPANTRHLALSHLTADPARRRLEQRG